MNQRDLYKLAIEAVGMTASTSGPIRNKLNRAGRLTDDKRLRDLVDRLLKRHEYASHVPAMPIEQMASCRALAAELVAYCRLQLDTPHA